MSEKLWIWIKNYLETTTHSKEAESTQKVNTRMDDIGDIPYLSDTCETRLSIWNVMIPTSINLCLTFVNLMNKKQFQDTLSF